MGTVQGEGSLIGEKRMQSWTEAQKERAKELYESGATLAYWCSDAHGRPANGGKGTMARG